MIARILFALALGLLVPLAGTVVIVGGETLLVYRLWVRNRERRRVADGYSARHWGEALRRSASKWGLALSMILFTLTLRDRIAEIGAGASVLLWLALNFRRISPVND